MAARIDEEFKPKPYECKDIAFTSKRSGSHDDCYNIKPGCAKVAASICRL